MKSKKPYKKYSLVVYMLSLMLAIGLVNTAHSALSKTVQADLLDSKIIKALNSKQYEEADRLFRQYDALGVKIPPPLVLKRIIVFYHLKKYLAAQRALEKYLSEAERGSKDYHKALVMYQNVEPLAKPQREREAAAAKAKAEAKAEAEAEAAAKAKAEKIRRFLAGDGSVPPSVASDYTNSIGMVFKNIPAGEFYMGSKSGESDEKPRHKVRISKKF